jgi:hypothetical protein
MPRRRIVDWGSPDGIDPDTPVVDAHDQDEAGRDALILWSDDERRTLAVLARKFCDPRDMAMLDRALRDAEDRERVIAMRDQRRRRGDRTWQHVAVFAAVVAAANIPEWVHLFTGH